ncbi:PHD finger protein 20-like protein 1 isoform X2 [Ylistrum balloti]|uniref:PHD finger protein 20-like protein 1 isoform X2 n=1 Tax=Ylistrum balloti TaxID=509963 RepID=UPI002905D777|nr:PHD finger protein 20-like protein 1 isoform X2 [Ylistrum balloti]
MEESHVGSMIEKISPKTEGEFDMHVDSPLPDPDDVPPSPPCGVDEEGLLDSSASSRASSDRGTPSKPGIRIPSGGGIGGGAGMADNVSTCSTSSSSSQTQVQGSGTVRGKCPNRPGIIWRKGEKVEAMDFMKKWYSAKIVDIDEEESTVLIHFEGWNQRYDEWVEMTSDKLRPKMRHSGRKEKRKRLSGDYKLGENVYARWTDCKMYPGKVTNVQSDGSYEIMFYDGFKKSVQPMNIRPRAVDVKQKTEIVSSLPKEQRKKSNEDEEAQKNPAGSAMISEEMETEGNVGRRRSCHLRSKVTPESEEHKSHQKHDPTIKQRKRPSSDSGKKRRRETTDGQPGKRNKDTSVVRKRSSSATLSKKKLIVAGSFFARRERTDGDSVSVKSSSSTGGAGLPHTGESANRIQFKVDVKPLMPPVARPATTSAVVSSPEPVPAPAPSCPANTTSTNSSVSASQKQPLPQKADVTHGVSGDSVLPVTIKREKKAKKRTASPSMSETSSTSESQVEATEGTPVRKRSRSKEKEKASVPVSQLSPSMSPAPPLQTQGTVPVVTGIPKKAFIIEQDHNHFKCVFEGCNKAFRKENLLGSHIKYYHCDDTKKPTLPQPTRKRRKTTSVCSTDSDVSSSSKQMTPVSKAHPMDALSTTPDVQECVTVDIVEDEVDSKVADMKHQRTCSQDTTATEESIETEDELSKDEVVNCICLFNEENGLMIQCDVCLCWQHAVCFDLTVETLPKKYICFVCSDPTGVRESCRYIHEQDWIKHGNLTKFGFLNYQDRDSRKAGTIQATSNLVSDIHNINTVLHSLKEEIKLSRDKDHRQFKIWTTDLDSEELCPEETGHGRFNQSNLLIDSDMNQSDSVLHSKINQSQLHTDSLVSQKDQLETSIKTETLSPSSHNIPAEQSDSVGVPLVMKSEPVDVSEVSDESTGTFQPSVNNTSGIVPGTDKDPGEMRNSPTENKESQLTEKQPTVSPSIINQSTENKSCLSTSSESDTGQSTLSQSSLSQSTTNQSVGSESTVSQSTLSQSSVSQSTNQSVGSEPTVSQSTDNIPTVSQSTDNVPAVSQSTGSESTVSQSTNTEMCDKKPETFGQIVQVKAEVLDGRDVEEDPFQLCERNLLQHILRVQGQVDSRLDMIEEQVIALESAEMGRGDNSCSPIQNPLTDLPTLKKSLHMLQSDLVKVKRMSAYHR